MFQALKNLAKRTKSLNQKILFRFVFSQTEVQDLVLDLNRIEQLFKKGIDSTGDIIGQYSATTEQLSRGQSYSFGGGSGTKRKVSGEPIFLLDEGDFYRSFKVKVLADGFVIQADALKDDGTDLTESFGKDILGITNESRKEIVKEILPMVLEKTRETLRG